MPSLCHVGRTQGVAGKVIILRPQRLERAFFFTEEEESLSGQRAESGLGLEVALTWESELWGNAQIGPRDGTVFYGFCLGKE